MRTGKLTFFKRRNRIKENNTPISYILQILTVTALIIYALSMAVTLVWLIVSSLKDSIEYILDPFGLPATPLFSNYAEVWNALDTEVYVNGRVISFGPGKMIFHTLCIAVSGTVLGLAGNTQVAYVLAKCRNKFTNFLWAYMIVMMFVPLGPSLVVSLKFAKWIGYYDNLWFMCIWGYGCFGGNMLIMYGQFKGLSDAYGEAAAIDGANPFRVFFSIYLPMVFPMIGTLFILALLGCWSDYMTTVVWLPSYPTLGYGLYLFKENAAIKGYGTPTVLSGYVITGLFSITLYLIFQNLITTKLTVGTLKQ